MNTVALVLLWIAVGLLASALFGILNLRGPR